MHLLTLIWVVKIVVLLEVSSNLPYAVEKTQGFLATETYFLIRTNSNVVQAP